MDSLLSAPTAPTSPAGPRPARFKLAAPSARRLTFAELYCAQQGLPHSAYADAALRDSLPLPARVLFRPLTWLYSDFFAADYDLISNIGQLTSTRDLPLDFEEYRYHPQNPSRLRRLLLLSASTTQVSRLVHTAFRLAHAP